MEYILPTFNTNINNSPNNVPVATDLSSDTVTSNLNHTISESIPIPIPISQLNTSLTQSQIINQYDMTNHTISESIPIPISQLNTSLTLTQNKKADTSDLVIKQKITDVPSRAEVTSNIHTIELNTSLLTKKGTEEYGMTDAAAGVVKDSLNPYLILTSKADTSDLVIKQKITDVPSRAEVTSNIHTIELNTSLLTKKGTEEYGMTDDTAAGVVKDSLLNTGFNELLLSRIESYKERTNVANASISDIAESMSNWSAVKELFATSAATSADWSAVVVKLTPVFERIENLLYELIDRKNIAEILSIDPHVGAGVDWGGSWKDFYSGIVVWGIERGWIGGERAGKWVIDTFTGVEKF